MILLGCNIYSILLDRLETSIKFIEYNTNIKTNVCSSNPLIYPYSTDLFEIPNPLTKITWFLSGGIKNNFDGAKSEASIIKSQLDKSIDLYFNTSSSKQIEMDYVLDEKSTNTAENFIWASQFLNTTFQEFDSIYVVTSAFHHERASVMFKLIDPSRNYNWILGNVEEKDSRYWETKHIVNALSDVEKAKAKLNLL